MDAFRKLFEGIRTELNLSVTTGIVFLAAAGLVFLIRPDAALTLICRLIGIIILVYGARLLIRYVSEHGENRGTVGMLSAVFGVILIIIGLFIAKNPVSLVRIASLLLSVSLMLAGLFWFLYLRGRSLDRTLSWRLCRLGAAALFIMGILMLFSPFAASVFILRLIGIAFLFAAAAGLMHHRKTRTEVKDQEIIDGTAEEITDDDKS